MRAISPFMPYLSEELYQRLEPETDSVCVAPYPVTDQVYVSKAEWLRCLHLSPGIISLSTIYVKTIVISNFLNFESVLFYNVCHWFIPLLALLCLNTKAYKSNMHVVISCYAPTLRGGFQFAHVYPSVCKSKNSLKKVEKWWHQGPVDMFLVQNNYNNVQLFV